MRGLTDAAEIENAVVESLAARLAPEGWRRRSCEPDDGVTFVREPVSGVVWRFSVNLGGHEGMSLSSSVGVEHTVVAEEQRRLFGRKGTVCQVGASMIDVVHDAAPSLLTPSRWWVGSSGDIAAAVDRVVADLKAYGEPFLAGNRTLPQIVETLNRRPKSQVEYATLAVCYAVMGDLPRARAMLVQFETGHRVFAGTMTDTFARNFAERFGL